MGLEQIFDDNSVIWHNFNNRNVNATENLAGLKALFAAVDTVKYTDIRRLQIPGGLLERHNLVCRRADEVLEMPTCMLIEVRSSRIVRMDEYIDPAPLLKLFPSGLHPDSAANRSE